MSDSEEEMPSPSPKPQNETGTVLPGPSGSNNANPTVTGTKDFILGFKNLGDYSNEGLRRVAEATKAFQSLPAPGPLWDLQKAYPEFRRAMKNSRTRIIPIMKTLLEHAKVPTNDFTRRDVQEKMDFLINANDDILERVGTALDDADGLFKRAEIVVVNQASATNSMKQPPGTWGKKKLKDTSGGGDFRDTTVAGKTPIIPIIDDSDTKARDIKKPVYRLQVKEKPQIKFTVPIDNSLKPFVPKLKFKPNSIKPMSILPEYGENNEEFYGHPYEIELKKWVPDVSVMTKAVPSESKPLDKTPLMVVSKPNELQEMLKDLRALGDFAVDLEHHSFRTYLGLTCVMQISTRHKDYVIDTLSLREELECLNEVFTNPKIIKVFHGAASDIEWLQRDLGLYVVGLFDTYFAMKLLDFNQFSLQHLLEKYCKIALDKKFQLADWRIRPLTDEMINYARQDTHYLLYVYDILKNQLIDAGNEYNNLLNSVYEQSKMICLKRYEKPANNSQLALRKTRRTLNNRQVYAFTELYKWRDNVAREKDESLGYVLPNHMLLSVSENLPKEMTGILACCEPVPPMVHVYLADIHRIVSRARDLPLHEEKSQFIISDKRKKVKNWVLMMNSIHDLDLEENEFEESSKSHLNGTNSNNVWPEPWIDPDNNSPPKVSPSKTPSLPFARSSRPKPLKLNPFGRATAYQRLIVTNEILDNFRNPKAKKNMDMEDPVIKVVHDTILDEIDDEAKPLSSETATMSTPSAPLKLSSDQDFIAFNPLSGAKLKQLKKRVKMGSSEETHSQPESNSKSSTPHKNYNMNPMKRKLKEFHDQEQQQGNSHKNRERDPKKSNVESHSQSPNQSKSQWKKTRKGKKNGKKSKNRV